MIIVKVRYCTLDNERVEMDVTSAICPDLELSDSEEEMILAAIRFARKNNEKTILIESVKIIAI